MDLSDGLADAVRQIAAASGVGAPIDAALLPIHPGAASWFRAEGVDPVPRPVRGRRLRAAVRLSSRARAAGRLADARRAGPRSTRIGELTGAGTDRLARGADRGAARRLRPFLDADARFSVASRWLEQLLHTHDTPHRTAAAFALGVFSASRRCSVSTHPRPGLAFLLRLNRVAVLLGVYSNLPWILGPTTRLAPLPARDSRRRRPAEGAPGTHRALSARSVGGIRAMLGAPGAR